MGRARSHAPNEMVYEDFEKIYFHNLADTASIWLSKFSWKEKPLIVPIRKSEPLGKTPGGAFRFEEERHGLNETQLRVQNDEKGHPGKIPENVQLVTAECNTKEFLQNHTHHLLTLSNQVSEANYFLFTLTVASHSDVLNRKPIEIIEGRKKGSS